MPLTSNAARENAQRLIAGREGSMSPSRLVVSCIRDEESLARIQMQWADLYVRVSCGNPFLSYGWMINWWSHWGSGKKLFVIAVQDYSGRLVGLAPFCIVQESVAGQRVNKLAFIADQHVGSDYLTIVSDITASEDIIFAIAREVLRWQSEWDYVELNDCAKDSVVLNHFLRCLSEDGLSLTIAEGDICPYVSLPNTVDEYLERLSSNVRYNFRRRKRALERKGLLALEILKGEEALTSGLTDLIRLHGARFSDQSRKSAFLDSTVLAFHRDTIKGQVGREWGRLYLLKVDGQPVAAIYGFMMSNKFLFYQSGIDPGWAKLSVGLVAMGLVIGEAIVCGIKEFDFLRGDEAYKAQWANQFRQLVIFRLYKGNAKSRFVKTMFGARRIFGKARSCVKGVLSLAGVCSRIDPRWQRLKRSSTSCNSHDTESCPDNIGQRE